MAQGALFSAILSALSSAFLNIAGSEARNVRHTYFISFSLCIVSATLILNYGVYLLFGFPFGIKMPPFVRFLLVYFYYTTLSNKRGAFHKAVPFFFVLINELSRQKILCRPACPHMLRNTQTLCQQLSPCHCCLS